MHAKKLYVEDKRGATGNTRLIEFAISLRSRNIYFPSITDMHPL